MTGHVYGHHALLSVQLIPPGHSKIEIEFVIDTGFVGFLTLPAAAVEALGLPYSHSINANLADDSSIRVAIYIAGIIWNGVEQETEVLATGSRPLLGTLLLDGHNLEIAFADGGLITVEPMVSNSASPS